MKTLRWMAFLALAAAAVACESQNSVADLEVDPQFSAWDLKVNGGGKWYRPNVSKNQHARLSISAMDFGHGNVRGQVEVKDGDDPPWWFHAEVFCMRMEEDGEAFLGARITELKTEENNHPWFYVGRQLGIHLEESAGPNGEDLGFWSLGFDNDDYPGALTGVPFFCKYGLYGPDPPNAHLFFPPSKTNLQVGSWYDAMLIQGNLRIRN